MSPRWIRRIVYVVFLSGIGGMIAGSIADNNGIAITFGLITAVAAIGLILVSSVAPPSAFQKKSKAGGEADPERDGGTAPNVDTAPIREATAADVEHRVEALVQSGADEAQVRQLVQRAIDMARGR